MRCWGRVPGEGHTEAIFGDVFEAVGLETERRLAVKVTELEKMRLQAWSHAVWATQSDVGLAIYAFFCVGDCEMYILDYTFTF